MQINANRLLLGAGFAFRISLCLDSFCDGNNRQLNSMSLFENQTFSRSVITYQVFLDCFCMTLIQAGMNPSSVDTLHIRYYDIPVER